MEWLGQVTCPITHALLLLLLSALQLELTFAQLRLPYDWKERECPDEDTKMMVNQVPWGVPGRAYLTLPQGLEIAPSKIKGAGFGVLSKTFIPKYTWLGEYEGEIVPRGNSRNISAYAWQVRRALKIQAYVDAYHINMSSYHRYINSPKRHADVNVIPSECHGKVYYITNNDIAPGVELLVYYGPAYSRKLNIDLNEYFQTSPALIAAGLDLNNRTHRQLVLGEGYKHHQMRNPPLSCLHTIKKKIT